MLLPSMITQNLSIFEVLSTLITRKPDPECYNLPQNLFIFKVLSALITRKRDPEYCYFCAK